MQLHSVLTVVMLFFFGLISPGPNFLIVAQASLTSGRVAGFVTAAGAACGDALYASIGLFGVTRMEALRLNMVPIEIIGGAYLAWLGIRMLIHRTVVAELASSNSHQSVSARTHFWRGLSTDLANPKTVIFFASIFAITVSPKTSGTVRGAMLSGIVLTSIGWRFFLSMVFSTALIRRIYQRTQRTIERVFGVALCFFGMLLVKRAVS